MAVDISNGIALKVTDSVSASIPNKLSSIATKAIAAGDAVANLQAQLDTINAAGISQLATSMRTTATAISDISTRTNKVASSFGTAEDTSIKFALALADLESYAQLATVEIIALTTAVGNYSKQALAAALATGKIVSTQNSVGNAAGGATAGTRGLASGFDLLEGRVTGGNFVLARFISGISGLGPLLQAAFPVIAAVALVEVLVQMGEAVYKVAQYWKSVTIEAGNAAAAMHDGNREAIAGQHSIGDWLKNAAVGRPNAPDVYIDGPSKIIASSTAWLAYQKAVDGANDAKYKGQAADVAKEASLQREGERLQQVNKNLKDNYDAIIKVRDAQILVGETRQVVTKNRVIPADPGHLERQIAPSTITSPNPQYDKLTAEADKYKQAILGNVEAYNLLGPAYQELVNKEPFAAAKDSAKAATAQMKAYELEFDKLKEGSKLLTPQDTLKFWQSKDTANNPKTYQQNELAISGKEGNAKQAEDRQAEAIANLNTKIQDGVADIGLYSDALTIKRDVDKDVLTLVKAGVPAQQAKNEVDAKGIAYIVSMARESAALKTIYNEFQGPALQYNATLNAAIDLWASGEITGDQFTRTINAAKLAMVDALDPMAKFNRGLAEQAALASVTGTNDQVAIKQQLISKASSMNEQGFSVEEILKETDALKQQLETIQQQKEQTEAYNAILQEYYGWQTKIYAQELALNQARKAGTISNDTYAGSMVKITNDVIVQHEKMGDSTWQQQAKGALTNYAKDYTNAGTQIGKLWDQTFSQIADGAADAIGRSIVYADNLGDALTNVAREALQGIISGLIKIGIQAIIAHTIAQSAESAAAAASIATAAGLAAAWWPVAEAVSLATFGANAAPASIGMATTASLGAILSKVGGFATGIIDLNGPGTGTSDSMLARLSAGESVMTAKATSMFKPELSAMAAAARGSGTVNRTGQGSQSQGLQVHVYNNKAGAKVTTEWSEGKLRVLIGDEIQKQTPQLVSSHIRNANSPISKSLKESTTLQRRND
jgi:hypothetical protein